MDLSKQLLFTLSIIGGINGLLLGVYFSIASQKNKTSGYFLSALLFVVSIRVLKSVFLYFNPRLSGIFIQIGLSACALIGPFLFLYIQSWRQPETKTRWFLHVIPITIFVACLGLLYPYTEHRRVWSRFIVKSIYLIWLVYILFSARLLRPLLAKFFKKNLRLESAEVWVLSVFLGVSVIWIGYNLGAFTSYIVGAISSSFVFYLLLLFWILKRKNAKPFFEEHIKYHDKKIADKEAAQLIDQLNNLLAEEKLYKNANLKIADIAKQLHITPHYLSQVLNDNLGESFSAHINMYRIEEAKNLLVKELHFTTEAIGYQCGFNSKSTFFAVFKRITGFTPATYRSDNQ
ncbi:MAG: helix-turn-helix transcriptional regulator [Bacteroidota bacterium]